MLLRKVTIVLAAVLNACFY